MKDLVEQLELLKPQISHLVRHRLREFSELRNSSDESLFKELCYCILTANFTAIRAMKIQETIDDGFLSLNEIELARRLKQLGYRFPNTRARYIVDARKKMKTIMNKIRFSHDELKLREWLVKTVKGFGMKESSHFLRNVGYESLAIIDFHIIDVLHRYGLIERPKTMSRKKYLEMEEVLRQLAQKVGMSLAELDLYLWYMETGKILK